MQESHAAARPSDLPPLAPTPPATVRLWSAGVLLVCLALLGIAVWLQPDARGYGTHEQLGAARCGSFKLTGYPCPTCGMTTAYAYTVRGQLIAAFWAQPAGLLMALGTIMLALTSAGAILRGRWPEPRWLWYFTPYRLLLAFLVFFVAGWAFKIIVGVLRGDFPVPAE
ncbi:MAG: DUF2752 domain-containing protein [Phycisphaerales bacterium]|nr:DUF2752 domain-containing protein [Phycisphaerales bacterium]